MTRQNVFTFVKRKYGTEPDYPWNDDSAVLRHRENKKWYAVIMPVGRDKLGLEGTVSAEKIQDLINLSFELTKPKNKAKKISSL